MVTPTISQQLASANLTEVGRRTPGAEEIYTRARRDYADALAVYEGHVATFAKRVAEREDLGGTVNPNVSEHRASRPVAEIDAEVESDVR